MKFPKGIAVIVLALGLAACSTAPVNPKRKPPIDQSWTAAAQVQAIEAQRPRGQIEAWELRRPAEFNRPD